MTADFCFVTLHVHHTTDDITDTIEQHDVSPHLYADDTQLLASSRPEDVPAMRQQPGSCVTDVSHWCAARRLQLNSDKTEAIWIGSKAAINKLTPQDRSLTVSNDTTIN